MPSACLDALESPALDSRAPARSPVGHHAVRQTTTTAPPEPAPPLRPRLHLDYIDGLRGCTALYVVLIHLLPRVWLNTPPETVVLKLLAKVLAQGYFAVSTFIVISGFCLMLPVIQADLTFRGGLAAYFGKRFWRILPPFAAAFALTAALIPLTLDPATGGPRSLTAELTPIRVLAHTTLLQNVIPGTLLPSNGVFWSIGVEWWIYFLFPGMILLARKIGVARAMALTALTAYALLPLVSGTPLAGFCPQYIALFAFGATGAMVALAPTTAWEERRRRVPWMLVSGAAFTILAAVCAVMGWDRASRFASYLDPLVGVGAVALLIGASQTRHAWARRLLGWKPLTRIGTFSYSLYLLHYPLETVLFDRVFSRMGLSQTALTFVLVFVCLPLILLAAFVFYRLCEAPFMNLAKRIGTAEARRT